MKLNGEKVIASSISILMAMFAIYLLYEEIGRHLIDQISSSYLPLAECESGNMEACKKAFKGAVDVQNVGYGLTIFVLFIITTFFICFAWYKGNAQISLPDIGVICLVIFIPLLIYTLNGENNYYSILLHWFPVLAGLIVYFIYEKKIQHNQAI